MILWPLFGTTNQAVAGLTLLVVSVWLRKQGRPYLYTLIPMLFVAIATVFSMLGEIQGYYAHFSERWLLAIMGSVILAFEVWVILEGLKLLVRDADLAAPSQTEA